MRAQARGLEAVLLQERLDFQGLVVERDGMKITSLAQQFAAVVHHRLHVAEAELRGAPQSRLERQVLVTDEFHVYANRNGHQRLLSDRLDIPLALPGKVVRGAGYRAARH